MILKSDAVFELGMDTRIASYGCQRISTNPHSHEFYEFFLVTAGAITHYTNGSQSVVDQNTLVFIRPADCHYYGSDAEGEFEMLNLAIKKECMERCLDFINDPQLSRKMLLSENPMQVKISQEDSIHIKETFNKTFILPKKQVDMTLKLVVQEMMGYYHMEEETIEGVIPPDWFRDACEKMHNKESIVAGIEGLYKLCCKSPEYVSRCFRKYLHTTPTNFVNELRIDYAKSLLTFGDLSVVEVCGAVGYESLSHFNHLFKKRYGLPPHKYRRAVRNNILP